MKRLHRHWAIATLLLLLALLTATATPLASQASDADLVLRAVAVLEQHYVDPLDPIKLLNAAIEGIRKTLTQAGLPAEALADLPPTLTEEEARHQFLSNFRAAATEYRGSERALAYAAIRAMTESLRDSHTAFLTPDQYQERIRQQRGEPAFSGIGIILLEREGRFYVWEVIPGSPAEAARLRRLDRILRVDGHPTSGLTTREISGLIRGPTGTTVTLTIQRAGVAEPFDLSIPRSPIRLPGVRFEQVGPRTAYLRIYQFNSGTAATVKEALTELLRGGVESIVLDLRGNPGGLLGELTRVAELIFPRGTPVYQIRERDLPPSVITTKAVPVLPAWVTISALVDESSASAAELLAAAIQERRQGVLVGTKTAGAVEASILISLPDGSALSVTIARMATGLGKRLEGVGVTPDVIVDLDDADLETGRDSQLEAAIRLAPHAPAEVTRPRQAPQLVLQPI